MPHKLTARGWLALLVCVTLWGSGFIGIRIALTAYSPAHLALLRFLAASVTILLYAVFARVRPPARKDLAYILMTGFVSITVYHVALNAGERTVTGGAASMLVASGPIFSALLARVALDERLRVWGWIGIAVSFLGVSLIAIGEGGGVHFNRGAFLVLIAAMATGISVVLQKHYLKTYNVTDFSTHLILAGMLFLLPFLPGLGTAIRYAPLKPTLAVVYLGVFPAAIAYLTWGYVLKRTPASVAASSLYTVPIFAILIGWMVLREVPSALSIAGGALAFAGVTLVNTKGHAPKPVDLPVYAGEGGD
ncbi:MAG TPA: DMT family transporter [Terriglobales bacterium]|nr:DMT family transporter [Terriglobales bacterium]